MRSTILLLALGWSITGCDVGEIGDTPDQTTAFATCSPYASDPDGDGWGWEPAHSCVVAGSGLDESAYPTCSAQATDPDGDDWGWEPAHSCRMGGGAATPGACAYVDGTCAADGAGCRVYDDDGARAEVKAEIWQQMYALHPGDLAEARCRADLAVAMAMQETHSFAVDGTGHLPYDWTKDDRTDGSQNVCVFNMNIDFLRRSCRQDCGRLQDFSNQDEKKYLNRRTSLRECVRRLDEAFDHFGIDGALHFHRGGSTGWQRPGDDERAFARAQKVVADHLRDHPSFRSSGARAAATIEHR